MRDTRPWLVEVRSTRLGTRGARVDIRGTRHILDCIYGVGLELDGLSTTLFFETVEHPNLADNRPGLEKQEACPVRTAYLEDYLSGVEKT